MITLDVTTTFVFSVGVIVFGACGLYVFYESYKLTLNGNNFYEKFIKSRAIFGFMEAAAFFILVVFIIVFIAFDIRHIPDILNIPFAIICFGAGYNRYYSAKKELESQTWDKWDRVKRNLITEKYIYSMLYIIIGLVLLGLFEFIEWIFE